MVRFFLSVNSASFICAFDIHCVILFHVHENGMKKMGIPVLITSVLSPLSTFHWKNSALGAGQGWGLAVDPVGKTFPGVLTSQTGMPEFVFWLCF